MEEHAPCFFARIRHNKNRGDAKMSVKKRVIILCALLFFIFAETAALSRSDSQEAVAAMTSENTEETKYVALTFDDGPRASTTGRLLEGLAERNAHATFFVIGRQIEGNEELIKRMAAQGDQVGNHTYNHTKLTGDDSSTVLQEINKTDVTLRQLLGDGDYWLRPPYGLIDEKYRSMVATPMVSWSVDPEDWKKLNTEDVVKAVLADAGDGDIILLHDFYPTSVDAALEIVDKMQAEGYEFVTVKELFKLKKITPHCGKIYRHA